MANSIETILEAALIAAGNVIPDRRAPQQEQEIMAALLAAGFRRYQLAQPVGHVMVIPRGPQPKETPEGASLLEVAARALAHASIARASDWAGWQMEAEALLKVLGYPDEALAQPPGEWVVRRSATSDVDPNAGAIEAIRGRLGEIGQRVPFIDDAVAAALAAEWAAGLERAAGICDAWEAENFQLAGDTIILDPFLRGDRSEEAYRKSKEMQAHGSGHAFAAHAAKNIAAAIRRLASERDPKGSGND